MKPRLFWSSFAIGVFVSSMAGATEPEISFDPELAPKGAAPIVFHPTEADLPPANPKLIVEPDGSKYVEIFGEKRPLSQIGFDVDGDHISEEVRDKMDKTNPGDTIHVYVKISVPLTDGVVGQIKSAVGQSVDVHRMTDWGLNHVALDLTPAQLERLSRLPFVGFIEPAWAGYNRVMMDQARTYTGVNAAVSTFCAGLNNTTCAFNGDHDGNRWAFSTNDVVVAVLDSGIDRTHEAFNGGAKIIGWTDQTNSPSPLPVDPHGHGTHVASIIAGESSVGYYGVAPGAALVGVRVVDETGTVPTAPNGVSALTSGLIWVLNNRTTYNIRVVNLSLGFDKCPLSNESVDQTLINQIIDAGVTVVASAQNSEQNTSKPRYCQINYLAAVPRVIAVANIADPATWEFGLGWTLERTSGWGPTADGVMKPDIAAPGTCIMAARAVGTGSTLAHCSAFLPPGYIDYTGTSMSTAFISGIVAGMLDVNWFLTPTDVKNYILNTAESAGGLGTFNNVYGKGYIKAFDIYKSLFGSTLTWDDGFDHAINSSLCMSQGTIALYTFNRTDVNKQIHGTLVANRYGINPGGQGDVQFQGFLINPSGTVVVNTGITSNPIKHLYRDPGGATGTWKIRVKAISTPTGIGCYMLDVTER